MFFFICDCLNIEISIKGKNFQEATFLDFFKSVIRILEFNKVNFYLPIGFAW